MREFIYYEDRRGRAPVEDFINELPVRERQQLLEKLQAMAGFPVLEYPHYLQFRGYRIDVGELRPGPFRILVHRISPTEYLLLHAFRKKTEHTPPQEAKKALNRLFDYLSQPAEDE